MGRPRKHDKRLPAYVRIRNGSYLYRDHKLCRVEAGEAAMYDALAKRIANLVLDTVPAAVAVYKLQYLPTLSTSARGEHARILDKFADEFSEYRVDQVEAHHIKQSINNLYTGKPHAARHYRSRISSFFAWCITDQGIVTLNPCREITLPKPKSRKSKWTPVLFWAIHAKLSPMHQLYHELSFLLYQRTTDIRTLKKTDARDGVIHFAPSKTIRSSGNEVDIPITPAIQAILDRAATIAREWRVISPFVVHTRQGSAYTRSGIFSAYKRADIELHGQTTGLNPKSLLPFAVTSAKKRGYTTAQLQTGRAHASITTTEGYIQHHEVQVSEVMLELPPKPNDKSA